MLGACRKHISLGNLNILIWSALPGIKIALRKALRNPFQQPTSHQMREAAWGQHCPWPFSGGLRLPAFWHPSCRCCLGSPAGITGYRAGQDWHCPTPVSRDFQVWPFLEFAAWPQAMQRVLQTDVSLMQIRTKHPVPSCQNKTAF